MTISRLQRQTLLWSAVAIAFGLLLLALGPVLTPFVTAIILAYVLEPGVAWLAARRVPRPLAAVLIVLITIIIMLAIFLILVPILQQEISVIRARLPGMFAKLTESTLPWLNERTGLDLRFEPGAIRDWFTRHLADSGEDIATTLLGYAKSGWGAAIQIIGLAFLVPVLLFYLLLDWPKLIARLDELLPRRWQAQAHELAGELDQLLGQYLRGQIRVMLVLAIYFSIGLLLAGFKLWLPIGVLTGLLIVIPYLGFALGTVFALIDGMLQLGPLHGLVAVSIIYGVGQVLESMYLTPRLVGERIGLHPVLVILALLAFGSLFGFVGILLALPLAAIASVGLRRVRTAYFGSDFYQNPPP